MTIKYSKDVLLLNYFDSQFRLKAFRYYENFGGQKMQWHTDNKAVPNTQDLVQKNTKVLGLIFIVYLSDVDDGEFQYIQGSHLWSSKNSFKDYSNKYIIDNFSDKIVSFKKKNFKYKSSYSDCIFHILARNI